MKLELKHLAGYLPYRLKIRYIERNETHDLEYHNIMSICSEQNHLKPILRPLSEFGDSDDLRKVHKFIGLGNWCEVYDQYFKVWFENPCSVDKLILQAPKEIFDYFLSKHFDVYNLIEKKLAIDINKI